MHGPIFRGFKSDPKALYNYVRSKRKVRSRIGQLKKHDGTLTLSDKEAVEVLSTFLKSVFTAEDASNIPDFPVRVDSQLNDFCITESDAS